MITKLDEFVNDALTQYVEDELMTSHAPWNSGIVDERVDRLKEKIVNRLVKKLLEDLDDDKTEK